MAKSNKQFDLFSKFQLEHQQYYVSQRPMMILVAREDFPEQLYHPRVNLIQLLEPLLYSHAI